MAPARIAGRDHGEWLIDVGCAQPQTVLGVYRLTQIDSKGSDELKAKIVFGYSAQEGSSDARMNSPRSVELRSHGCCDVGSLLIELTKTFDGAQHTRIRITAARYPYVPLTYQNNSTDKVAHESMHAIVIPA